MGECKARRKTVVFTVGFLTVFTVVVIFGAIYAEPRLLYAVFLLYLGWRWYQVLRTPLVVRFAGDRPIEIKSLARRIFLEPGQIEKITQVGRGYWMVYEGGSLTLFGNMLGLEEFFAYLRSSNPGLEFKKFRLGQQG